MSIENEVLYIRSDLNVIVRRGNNEWIVYDNDHDCMSNEHQYKSLHEALVSCKLDIFH